MSYKLAIAAEAQQHIDQHRKAGNKSLLSKLYNLLAEIVERPRSGTGKPEQLRHRDNETWSRRLDRRHRIVYQIKEDEVLIIVISAYGHYDDK